jgi:dTDP-glucose 4,6-dehydratase
MENTWNGRNVLVTGAGGFIGSHLVEALLARGAGVRAFVRCTSRVDPGLLRHLDPAVLAEVEIFAGDLRDERAVSEAVRGCQVVFHLGALVSGPASCRRPAEAAGTNFMGTLNVLAACLEQGVERLVHTSTSEVYGRARQLPIREAHPLQSRSPYAASRIGADKLAESFFCAYQLPVVTVRPFDTFGPRQPARALIPSMISQALTSDALRLGDKTGTRDFTFVSDTVRGFILAAEACGVEGQVFNLGSGRDVRIDELARAIIRLVGRPLEIAPDAPHLRPEPPEVTRLLADNSLACQRLGWKPEISLEQGLELTIAWMREHLELYRWSSSACAR